MRASINVVPGSADDFDESTETTAQCSPETVIFGAGVAGKSFGALEQDAPWQGNCVGIGSASKPTFCEGVCEDGVTAPW